MDCLLKLYPGDIDMPYSHRARLKDHPDRILTDFSRHCTLMNAFSTTDSMEEISDQLRLYLKRHLLESQTAGPSKRDPINSLATLILLSSSLPRCIFRSPQVRGLLSQ